MLMNERKRMTNNEVDDIRWKGVNKEDTRD